MTLFTFDCQVYSFLNETYFANKSYWIGVMFDASLIDQKISQIS